MKKLFLSLSLAIMIVVVALGCTGCGFSDEIYLDKYNIDVEIQDNGDALIKENWSVKLDGTRSFRNLYRTINLYDKNFNTYSKLSDFKVYDLDKQKYYRFDDSIRYIESSDDLPIYSDVCYTLTRGNALEIGLVMDKVDNGTRNFVFSYKISNLLAQYKDCAVFYYKMLDESFSLNIDNFSMKVVLKGNRKLPNPQAYLHMDSGAGEVVINENSFVYRAKQIEKNNMLETRILLDNQGFSDVVKVSNRDTRKAINEQEAEWARKDAEKKRMMKIRLIADIVAGCLIVVAMIIAVIVVNKKNKPYDGNYPDYYRETPKDWTVAEYGFLFYYYKKSKKGINGKIMSATILELARRKYIEFIASEDDYKIDISDHMRDNKTSVPLKPNEQTLFNLLLKVYESNGQKPFDMDYFEKYSKQHYESVSQSMKTFVDQSRGKLLGGGYIDKAEKAMKNSTVASVIVAIVGVVVFFATTFSYIGIGCILGGIIGAIFMPKIRRLSEKGELEYRQAVGLKQYMLDFSNLKEYEIPHLILWEEYLVYATMMGISKEVIEQIKVNYKEVQEMKEYNRGGGFFWTYMFLSSPRRRNSFDMGSSFEHSMNSIAMTVNQMKQAQAAKNFSSHSGGGGHGGSGFSGGGGGFGGGGGGAR